MHSNVTSKKNLSCFTLAGPPCILMFNIFAAKLFSMLYVFLPIFTESQHSAAMPSALLLGLPKPSVCLSRSAASAIVSKWLNILQIFFSYLSRPIILLSKIPESQENPKGCPRTWQAWTGHCAMAQAPPFGEHAFSSPAFSTPVLFMVPRFPFPRFQRPRTNLLSKCNITVLCFWQFCW